ncbi:MAG TPA: YggS family pyridoxal phosphate-dependent enzyme [Dysgonomonas sp.]|nr:YggS family pyridoxal phosphate-dependent enzyme [Dysgonomonas sp.]
MNPASNLTEIKSNIPPHVKLVAVSKFHPKETVAEVYNAGQRVFGESRVQELDAKQAQLPSDIEWHLIGHLQTNKIKVIMPYIHTIQSVDSWKLLQEINKYASRINRRINCLLEIHIAKEESKFGFTFDSCREMLENEEWKGLGHISITGLMGMATYTDDTDVVRSEFRALKHFFDEIKGKYFSQDTQFRELSMGMSHDYRIAIEEGSTIVRIGTSIFGEREY